MDNRQLLYRLTHNQFCLMNCGYRAKGYGQEPVYERCKGLVGWRLRIFMKISKKQDRDDNSFCWGVPYFLLRADHLTGKVLVDYNLDEYLDDNKDIYLDGLLDVLSEKYADELDFSELKVCINDHKCDMELRNRVLQLVALKLLYSRNTTPERGYERAKRFIGEFNKKMGLNLTTDEIDDIINRDYSKDEIAVDNNKGIRRLVRKIMGY